MCNIVRVTPRPQAIVIHEPSRFRPCSSILDRLAVFTNYQRSTDLLRACLSLRPRGCTGAHPGLKCRGLVPACRRRKGHFNRFLTLGQNICRSPRGCQKVRLPNRDRKMLLRLAGCLLRDHSEGGCVSLPCQSQGNFIPLGPAGLSPLQRGEFQRVPRLPKLTLAIPNSNVGQSSLCLRELTYN